MNKYVRRMLDAYENIARTYEYRLETFDEIAVVETWDYQDL